MFVTTPRERLVRGLRSTKHDSPAVTSRNDQYETAADRDVTAGLPDVVVPGPFLEASFGLARRPAETGQSP